MNAGERREEISKLLQQADRPLSASRIAAHCKVSRQIIVGDIALLRAGGLNILATPRGYVLENAEPDGSAQFERSIACQHTSDGMLDELYTIIDNGGAVLDVTVEHSVYGQICAPLHLFSRYDVNAFQDKLFRTKSSPLSALTNGIHLHRIRCANEEIFQRITQALREKGFLYEENTGTEK